MSFYPKPKPDLSLKKNAQIAHAQRRAKERLGIDIDAQSLANKIRNGESKFLYRESLRISHHSMLIGGKVYELVYDRKRNVVVTILFTEGENKNVEKSS